MSPEWLRPLDPADFPSPGVGIAIRLVDPARGQLHVSIAHRGDEAEPVRLLSQDWHHCLTDKPPRRPGLWVQVAMPEDKALALAALCRKVYDRNVARGIPYAVRYDGARLVDEGLVELMAGTQGLTCATFVMFVFEQGGEQLLHPETWPPRPEDGVWHEWVLETLEEYGASREHVQAVRAETGCARFRPEEVAAAGACDPRPAAFDTVVAPSTALSAFVRGLASP